MRQLLAARCMRENCGTPRRRGTEVAAGREEAETKPEAAAMTGIEAETVTVTEIGIEIVTGGIVTVTGIAVNGRERPRLQGVEMSGVRLLA
mmetsp:Transcript_8863/g.21009  ORF Transcript_8863/g.21009 Transcript_8863/m.21009 type:complete len:91 (-) Transcript_8863:55-327(-)